MLRQPETMIRTIPSSIEKSILSEFYDCNFMGQVLGDSMEGRYQDGDTCVGIKLPQDFLKHIRFGEAYYITALDGVHFGFIQKGSSPDKLMVRKYNKNYDPYEIRVFDVLNIAHIKGKFNFKRMAY